MSKPSAYRSMHLGKLGLTKPSTKKNKGALLRWTKEKWLNLNALKYKNICANNSSSNVLQVLI